MANDTELRDILHTEYGIEVPIYKGNGESLDDPYVIENDGTPASRDYTSIEYLVINSLCKRQNCNWKLISQGLSKIGGKSIDSMKIEIIYLDQRGADGTVVKTYYFDITDCINRRSFSNKSGYRQYQKADEKRVTPRERKAVKSDLKSESPKNEDSFKKKVIKFTAVIIILMGAFPPWNYVVHVSSQEAVKPAHYSFLLNPPEPERDSPLYGVKIDFIRLLLQFFVVLASSALIIYLRQNNKE